MEDCAHILECDEEGRVEALMLTIDMLELWLQQESTDPGLVDCIVRYARGRGGVTMEEICSRKDNKYYQQYHKTKLVGGGLWKACFPRRALKYNCNGCDTVDPKRWSNTGLQDSSQDCWKFTRTVAV